MRQDKIDAAFMLAGHSSIGRRQFFLPMLDIAFDPTAKRTMEFVGHMSAISLVLPPIVLLYAEITTTDTQALHYIVIYLALQFAAWGVDHLLPTTTSGLPGAIYKMFQWMLFLAIGGLA